MAMFQDQVLKALWTQDDPETICNRLEVEGHVEPLDSCMREMEPRMVELTAELVKRWGQKVNLPLSED